MSRFAGRTILVTYDYRANQSIAVPEIWRKTIEDFEAGKDSWARPAESGSPLSKIT